MRNLFTKTFGSSFSVTVIPTLQDNFSYLVHDHDSGDLAAVDVNSDYAPLLDYAQKNHLLGDSKHRFNTILSTHRHWDHAGGNVALRDHLIKKFSAGGSVDANAFTIVGGAKDNIPGATKTVTEGDVFKLGSLQVAVLDVPCHTKGHVLYAVSQPSRPADGVALFTGDTMFIAGIGAFFEGSAKDMASAMAKIYNLNAENAFKLDEVTFIFPGHEYTAGFMKFAKSAFPDRNAADYKFIEQQAELYAKKVRHGDPSVPSSLADEKKQNLFLRTADDHFCALMGKGNAVALMDYLYNACD